MGKQFRAIRWISETQDPSSETRQDYIEQCGDYRHQHGPLPDEGAIALAPPKTQSKARKNARQFRIRIRHEITVGRWFDYLLASKKDLQQTVDGTPWRVKKFINSNGPSCAMIVTSCRSAELCLA